MAGWKVPLTSWPASDNAVAAASSSVRFMLLTSPLPPASDIMIAFCPPGPTSKISRSSGNVWVKPVRSTVTLVTVPVNPDTVMSEGYGLDAALSLIVIAVAFAKFPGVHAGVPVKVAVGVEVAVAVKVGVAVFVGVFVEVRVGVFVAVLVDVGELVAVDVAVNVGAGDAVAVAVGVLHVPSLLKISENLRIEPVSTPALSDTFSTHVPSPLTPLNTASEPVVSGEKFPDSVWPLTLVNVETFAKPP